MNVNYDQLLFHNIENIKKAQEQQVQQYNKKIRELVKFKVGDLVLRKNHSKMMSFPKERWTGPWKVLEVTNRTGTAYRISRVQDPKATSTVNVVDLRLFYERGNDVVVPTLGGVSTSSHN
ncbi:hypothetical protein G6F57_013039 [Rhizopus arrhizus]|nr:hypothetical protein G6F34_012191 [Rhizopus arrhizus]KAG0928988.1 hypothetical protein G6F30_012180 [Rhizopus arrhizus]KAG0974379.1 hypothetical protein G6F29_012240 [Rhizopus arrhizus]KAG0978206.1 hypothetical protein G6F28_012206 [Rhizopus arrhizus]KAG1002118.1 hypothetical protein G6F27_012253 [Rhizopus arrhizus]